MPTPLPNFGTQPTLWALLSLWVAAELDAAWEQNHTVDHVILDRFDDLAYHLPRFGNPEGPWTYTVDKLALKCGDDYVPSNVSGHYYVNGKFVQFFGRLGRVTVYAD
jgi:hypothetical protein